MKIELLLIVIVGCSVVTFETWEIFISVISNNKKKLWFVQHEMFSKKKKLYLNAFNSHSFILRELEKYMENRKHINHKSEREWEWSCSLWMEKRERKKNFKLKAPTNKSTRAINISFCKLTWCEPRQRGVKISIKFAEYHLCWIYLLFHFFLSLCLCLKNEFCFFATEFAIFY
jgi:hypothetical protein